MLGDEGGAWWIAQKAMKLWFDDLDGMNTPQYSTDRVAEAIKSYFDIPDRFGLLTYCYDKFEKPHFAGVKKNTSVPTFDTIVLRVLFFRILQIFGYSC